MKAAEHLNSYIEGLGPYGEVTVSSENDPTPTAFFLLSTGTSLSYCSATVVLTPYGPLEGIIQQLTDQPGSTLLILCRLPARPTQSWSRRSVPLDDDLWVFVAVSGAWNITPD